MEMQDKILEKIKQAAQNPQSQSFAGLDKVWKEVEKRLDTQQDRKVFPLWKMGIAASVLLLLGSGLFFLFLKEDKDKLTSMPSIVKRQTNAAPLPKRSSASVQVPIVASHSVKEKNIVTKHKNGMNNSLAIKKTRDYIVGNTLLNDSAKNEYVNQSKSYSKNADSTILNGLLVQNDIKGFSTANTTGLLRGKAAGLATNPSRTSSYVASLSYKKERMENLQEVVVVGYGSVRKRTMTGSSSSMVQNNVASEYLSNPRILYKVNGKDIFGGAKVLSEIPSEKILKVDAINDKNIIKTISNKDVDGVVMITTKSGYHYKEHRGIAKWWNNIFSKKKNSAPIKIVWPRMVDENWAAESYENYIENSFESPVSAPLSTFSIDVDNASYTNIRRFINNGQPVPQDAVRIEEMINFFKYNSLQPKGEQPFAVEPELSFAPWNPLHQLLKITLQGKKIPEENLPASNLVFLIDISGSMSDDNKLPLLKSGLKLLVQKLRAQDKVSIVTYANGVNIALPVTSGSEKDKIRTAINNLDAGGSTAGSDGINAAYRLAQENFIKEGNNRIILATDGDFNVGPSSDKDMAALIEEKRKSNIFLTCLGVGMGNYKDSKIQTLADKGNGNYAYLDNIQEANRFLVKEFGGTMFTIAKDVKIQVEFNPAKVAAYRLIGYETRKLQAQDFANDSIDAGELGSGHTVTALYEIIPFGVKNDSFYTPVPSLRYRRDMANGFDGELANIKLRYKKPSENKSKELVTQVWNKPEPINSVSTDFRLASTVAWFGLRLRDSQLIPDKSGADILQWGRSPNYTDEEGYIAELLRLIDASK